MSTAYKNRKKALKRLEIGEEKALRNRIRNGVMPAYHFAKDEKNIHKLETELRWNGRWTLEAQEDKTFKRVKVMVEKRTWRSINTFQALRPERKEQEK